MNLGDRCGDDPEAVAQNRARLVDLLGLPAAPCWLRQVHGSAVVQVSAADSGSWQPPQADAAVSDDPHAVLAILSADCLPLVVSSRDGTRLGVAHAGWRSLADGVIENLLARFERPGRELMVWLGPAIGADSFEVGPELRQRFVDGDADAGSAFRPGLGDRWFADLYALARLRLTALGVEQIYGGEYDTFADRRRFHSYRRDGTSSGRMATLLWRATTS